jgi:hypothetical protein
MLKVFDLIQLGLEPTFYCTKGRKAKNCTTDMVLKDYTGSLHWDGGEIGNLRQPCELFD